MLQVFRWYIGPTLMSITLDILLLPMMTYLSGVYDHSKLCLLFRKSPTPNLPAIQFWKIDSYNNQSILTLITVSGTSLVFPCLQMDG